MCVRVFTCVCACVCVYDINYTICVCDIQYIIFVFMKIKSCVCDMQLTNISCSLFKGSTFDRLVFMSVCVCVLSAERPTASK